MSFFEKDSLRMKPLVIRRHLMTMIAVVLSLTMWLVVTLYIYDSFFSPNQQLQPITPIEYDIQRSLRISNTDVPSSASKRLIFYNKPPKTGSTSIRIAMNRALRKSGLNPAKCYTTIFWNEVAYKTIIKRRNIDFWGCHIRLTPQRVNAISSLRNGNVTYITGTRDAKKLALSSYLQEHRDRDVASISDPVEMEKEVERYKKEIENYPIDALYAYHGATEPLTKCPVEWRHELAMYDAAAKYEAIIDLTRPQESAKMVELVTGLKPDFEVKFNERTTKVTPMLQKLADVDVSHKNCGNELVHKILLQQFNLIKDRLMQNMCFNEDTGSIELCNKADLSKDEIKERNRNEQYEAKRKLESL